MVLYEFRVPEFRVPDPMHPHGENSMLWREFAEKISSIICIDRKEDFKECLLMHEKCLLAPEGTIWKFRLNDLCKVIK